MSNNYIVINGKKAELTVEQIKALGIEVRKNPFERVGKYEGYYCIKETGEIYTYYDDRGSFDNVLYAESNYFNDKNFANQVALHQLLYRKLLKYAYDNEFEDEEWDGTKMHAYIIYNFTRKNYDIRWTRNDKEPGTVYFKTPTQATAAFNEIVMPFMKDHPEFVW